MSEFYKEEARKKPSQFDRYKNCKILVDLETRETLLETRDSLEIKTDVADKYHTVQANEEQRLDLIAYKYYGNPLLWWIIAQANDIYDPIIYPVSGTILRIPSITKMYDKDGILL